MTRHGELGSMVPVTSTAPARTDAAAAASTVLDLAAQQARDAALASLVVVEEVTRLGEMQEIAALYDRIWGKTDAPPITVELMRALSKAGNYVAAAVDHDTVVGACVGFFHAPAHEALHSHIAGVAPDTAGRHVGFALKLHQRAWAMAQGIADIAWTFDPLVSRNAHFNITKLAAEPVEYLRDFYGAMRDDINSGDASDRLLIRWRLADPDVVLACSGKPRTASVEEELAAGAVVMLAKSDEGGLDTPIVPGGHSSHGGSVSLVAVPRDIEALRRTDPALAERWREQVRDALTRLLADGGRIAGFDRTGWYVVRRDA